MAGQTRLEKLRKERIKKLGLLRKLGIDPYPARWSLGGWELREDIEKVRRKKLGSKVMTAGRLWGWREHGKTIFADLRDESGQIQLWFQEKNLGKKDYGNLKLLDVGDFLGVSGRVTETQAGELSLDVTGWQILTKSLRPLPDERSGLKDVEIRYRQRYVDLLLNPQGRQIFETRTKIVKLLREFMDSHGFFEVETPILQPIYGGASARPFVTHHHALDEDFYLRISDELYLKRLIVGGFDKVYEIGKVFRNEGIDRAHNPEFTMMEFYWAYADYEDLIRFSQELLASVLEKTRGGLVMRHGGDELDFTPPWQRKTYQELLLESTRIDIEREETEEKLKKAVKDKSLEMDLRGVVGYGALCDKLYKEFIRPQIIQPTLVTDYPTAMIPLAKKKEGEPSQIATFQLVVKGYELIKAYNELNDPLDQRERWEEEEYLAKKGLEEHMVVDEDYIRALEYGMPPTAGWGLGIDRLTAILTNKHSIKETILFPTLRPEK